MAQDIWVIMQGETGAVRTGHLSDFTGNVNLSVFSSVTFIAQKDLNAAAVINAVAVIDPDQVTNKGKLSYTFTAPNAAIPIGTYLISFKCMLGITPYYFPMNRQAYQCYGSLIVQDPLG